MQKLADFIVNKRTALLVSVLVLTGICGFLMVSIPVNKDMSKYLANDSNMQQGISLMNTEFPSVAETSIIRVMFEDLGDEEKIEIRKKLEGIEYVSSVNYDNKSDDYNKGKYTLFIIHSEYGYRSPEELHIEKFLKNNFHGYKMHFRNNDVAPTVVPINLIALALAIMFVVLFVMSDSWLLPIFYMATIGIAVIINLGTSFFFPFLAEITVSMGPILQLALSMDYSIMLTDRYKQELLQCNDKIQAMKSTVRHSFSSVASSSITTAVGLLALVFLSFKLGPEIGIVMAKGVFISMLCVFIVLPFFILKFSDAIEKSKKKSLHIPIGFLAHFSIKTRFAIPVIFAVLFSVFFVIQRKTDISFTEGNYDPVAEIFPKDNPVVLLYHNDDEPQVEKIISEISNYNKHGKPFVKNIIGYANTLNQKLSAGEMANAISMMSSNMPVSIPIDDSMISLLYYLKFDGRTKPIAAGDFLAFLKDNFADNEIFASYAGGMNVDINTYASYLDNFSNRDKLLQKISPSEMADFFDMGAIKNLAASNATFDATAGATFTEKDLEKLYLYYYTKNGGVEYGTITLPKLADFLINTVAGDEMYAGMFDQNTLAQLETLRTYTNVTEMTKQRTYKDSANVLGMDAASIKLLYVYYFSQQKNYTPSNVVFGEFLDFLKDDVAENPAFSSYISESDMKKLKTFGALIPNKNKTMTPQQLFEELNKYQKLEFDNVKFLLTYKDAQDGKFENANKISVQEIINYLVANKDNFGSAIGNNYENLLLAQKIINTSVAGTSLSPSDVSKTLGMDERQAQSLFLLYKSENGDTSDWLLSPQVFISFAISDVLSDKMFASYFDDATSAQLLGAGKLVDAVVDGKKINASEMYSLFTNLSDQITEDMMELLYLYYAGTEHFKNISAKTQNLEIGADVEDEWGMTIPEMFDYISNKMINDERFAVVFDDNIKKMILDSKPMLEAAAGQMKSENYSRLIFMTTYPDESEETLEFVADLDAMRHELKKDSYMIGVSAMVYEMANSFSKEFMFITVITTIAIFAVVLVSFRNIIVALLLTMLVQCGVFITVAVIGWRGGSIYYLALLIVQSILMGATIDYAIVLCNYYRESRKSMDKLDALKVAYEKSIHTIATSGSILILATAVLGAFSTVAIIAQVCSAISLGTLIAATLILLILPGMLVAFDRLCVKQK